MAGDIQVLVLGNEKIGSLVPPDKRNSLVTWFNLYMELEASACAANTARAKRHDLEQFLDYFRRVTGQSDQPDQWTRPVTAGHVKELAKLGRQPTSINRALATLRHCSAWIQRHRPFLAGNPCERIADIDVDDPAWKGLSDIEVTRLRSASEQLLKLKTGKNQHAVRDNAIFLVLLLTGLRVSELLNIDLDQYQGKHFVNVRRKGRKVTRKVFLVKDAKEAIDRYVDEARGQTPGPLFVTRSGERLQRQNVDEFLKSLANQANAQVPSSQRIALSAHVLRHTLLRRAAETHGVQYAIELAGHTSSNYIFRYVQPTDEQKEQAMEELF
jgi:integrase/recombinase XerD